MRPLRAASRAPTELLKRRFGCLEGVACSAASADVETAIDAAVDFAGAGRVALPLLFLCSPLAFVLSASFDACVFCSFHLSALCSSIAAAEKLLLLLQLLSAVLSSFRAPRERGRRCSLISPYLLCLNFNFTHPPRTRLSAQPPALPSFQLIVRAESKQGDRGKKEIEAPGGGLPLASNKKCTPNRGHRPQGSSE